MNNISTISKVFCNFIRPIHLNNVTPLLYQAHVTQTRSYKKGLHKVYRDLYKRRCLQGPEPHRLRSELLNWNYNSELYSFGARLHEQFDTALLRQAFTDRSYLTSENERRTSALQIEAGEEEGDDTKQLTTKLDMDNNEMLAKRGKEVCRQYLHSYLKQRLPKLPEDGIHSISEYLMDDSLVTKIFSLLGGDDLILSKNAPQDINTSSQCFYAILSILPEGRIEQFIEDILITQLNGKLLSDLWTIASPVSMLQDKITAGEVEYRLLRETGSSTILSSYQVGVYCDKQLIGKGNGETITTAEEMAARNTLEHYYEFSESHAPFSNHNNNNNAADLQMRAVA